jgi:hypothetical protein
MNANTGFDLSTAINWYHERADELIDRLPKSFDDECLIPFEYLGNGRTVLKIGDLRTLINLLPTSAIARSGLLRIVWDGPHWFHHASTATAPTATKDLREALSPTAIIPSFVAYSAIDACPHLGSTITLFEMDHSLVPPMVQRILYSQAFLHEVIHSIVTPALYRDIAIELPNGHIVDAGAYLLDMQEEMQQVGPISQYSSAYWQNGVPHDILGLNEEVTELLTFRLLGFVVPPTTTTIVPLEKRQKLMEMLDAFLHARAHVQ